MGLQLSDRHIRELDGLRGLAVIMVLVWHFVGVMVRRDYGWWADALHGYTIFGRTGVDLFFVLSGFLIIGILIDHRDSPNLLRAFYARRFFRIHPPYIALIAAYWLCYLVMGPSRSFNTSPDFWTQFLSQITFTFNWLMADQDGAVARAFSVTWSVGIEEWFYLLFPAIVVVTPTKRLLHVLAGLALVSVIARAGMHIAKPDLSQAPYVLLPFRLDGLCMGGMIAIAYRSDAAMKFIRRNRRVLATMSIAMVAAIPFIVEVIRFNLWRNMFLWGHLYMSVAYSGLILTVLVFAGVSSLTFLRGRVLVLAGLYSYSLYLFHPLFLNVMFGSAGRPQAYLEWVDVALASAALTMTIVFCVLLHRFVEGPLRRFGRRIKYDQPLSSAAIHARA